MKIMVLDVAANKGGALTILKMYYENAVKDIENEWIFVVSTPDLKENENLRVVRFPWVKKSWFHRLYFDVFIAKKIAKQYNIEEVISLQNTIIVNLNIKQTLYLHQPLPFVEKRYRLTENLKFWVYQNIISKIIFESIKKADKVIVQTEWMKKACLKKVTTDPGKFEIKQPALAINVKKYYKQGSNNDKIFFYPAGSSEYKNHKIIVEATQLLVKREIKNFRAIFTLKGNEEKHIKNIYRLVKENNLPIDFIGPISLEEVYDYYSKSILVFPSYIETFGLPLLEAKMHNSPILASDCEFSHEILDGYDNAKFFDPYDSDYLASLMIEILKY